MPPRRLAQAEEDRVSAERSAGWEMVDGWKGRGDQHKMSGKGKTHQECYEDDNPFNKCCYNT